MPEQCMYVKRKKQALACMRTRLNKKFGITQLVNYLLEGRGVGLGGRLGGRGGRLGGRLGGLGGGGRW